MTAHDALILIEWTKREKIQSVHLHKFNQIEERAKKGIKPDAQEEILLNVIYRYTNDGGDKQDQPFKAYRRKTSWGVK